MAMAGTPSVCPSIPLAHGPQGEAGVCRQGEEGQRSDRKTIQEGRLKHCVYVRACHRQAVVLPVFPTFICAGSFGAGPACPPDEQVSEFGPEHRKKARSAESTKVYP